MAKTHNGIMRTIALAGLLALAVACGSRVESTPRPNMYENIPSSQQQVNKEILEKIMRLSPTATTQDTSLINNYPQRTTDKFWQDGDLQLGLAERPDLSQSYQAGESCELEYTVVLGVGGGILGRDERGFLNNFFDSNVDGTAKHSGTWNAQGERPEAAFREYGENLQELYDRLKVLR